MKRIHCCLCAWILLCWAVWEARAEGLRFEVGDKPIKERTSYRVFKEECRPTFTDSFSISFELSIRGFDNFGYLFLLRNGERRTSYSLTYSYQNEEQSMLRFNTDGEANHFTAVFDNDKLEYTWIPVRLDFDLKQDCLSIKVADSRETVIRDLGMGNPFVPDIRFGRYDYILDIPAFAIRNLKVEGRDKKYFFPLNESAGEDVHDVSGRVLGHVEHPDWLINEAYHWKLLHESHSLTPSGVVYDERRQLFRGFNQDSLWTYSPRDGERSGLPYTGELPVHLQLGTHFLNTTDGRLYVYELNNLPLGDVTVAALDSTCRWEAIGTASLPVQLHHHTGFWDRRSGKYCLFGGFGNKRYSRSFLTYAPEEDRWDTLRLSGDISPRYFSGMAVDTAAYQLYIYGGMGNEAGEQSMGRNYYHDLYRVDLAKRTVSKLWEHPMKIHRVPVRGMVLSADKDYLYLIAYPEYRSETYLQMYRMEVASGEMLALGDSIPMVSDEITTNANLYFDGRRNEFYCTLQEFGKDGQVDTRIYSLLAPAVSAEEMAVYRSQASRGGWLWMVAALVATGTVVAWRLCRRRPTVGQPALPSVEQPVEQTEPAEPQPMTLPSAEMPSAEGMQVVPAGTNAIYLFGNFTVLDRKGIDISHLFSARIRRLFLYVLLHGSHGVLSASLNEVFWADKPDDKVKNLKGVTINQLRKLLAELDGIELTYEKGYFRMVLDEACYCDYYRFVSLSARSDEATQQGEALSGILLRGKFLEGDSSAELDGYKARVEEFLSSYFPLEMDRRFRRHGYEQVIRLCNAWLALDSLNETALSYLVYTLNRMGNSQEAILRYSAFIKEYRRLMGEDSPLLYKDLTENVPVPQ